MIHTEEQNELYLRQVEGLLQRKKSLTTAEKELLELLTVLIEDFEERHYPSFAASPAAALEFLMDQHHLGEAELADIIGTPSVVSEVLRGSRELNKTEIRRLSERFHVSPELFF